MAFRVSLLLFAALNLGSWISYRYFPVCCDQQTSFGFPFPVHISGDITGESQTYLLGMLLDVAVALTVALLVTWIAELIKS